MEKKHYKISRWILLLILIAALGVFFGFRLYRFINFETIKAHHSQIMAYKDKHYLWTLTLYLLTYIIATAISIPGATFITVTGGYLFGLVAGTIYTLIGATLGALILYYAVKTSLGDLLRKKAGPFLSKMEEGFSKNEMSYMLFLRFIPLFPFWAVNLVAALIGVSVLVFIVGTFIGIIPATVVYTSIGKSLTTLIEQDKTPDFGIIFKPSIFLPILGLAVLALLPIFIKRKKK